jgi:small subunit ribosomal protein S1
MFLLDRTERSSSATSTVALGVLACAGVAHAFVAPGALPTSAAPGLRASATSRPSLSTLSMATATKGQGKLSKFEQMRQKYSAPSTMLSGGDVEETAGFNYDDFESAMSKFDTSFQLGDIVVGQVVQFEVKGALVDVGGKASAFLSNDEVSMQKVDNIEEILSIGDNREFQITSNEDENGSLQLSIRRIEFARAWERVRQIQAEDCTISAEILSINRGGALVSFEGLRGFLPGSHAPRGLTDDMIGTEIPLTFLEVDQAKNRLVVSNRRAVVETQMRDLNPGEVVKGVVRGIKPYGAFVDIGGVSGLLHISQISHDHIADIKSVLEVDSEIKAMVISQDKDKGRFSLSTKSLEPEPGDMVRNPQAVFDQAEAMAARYHERLNAEQKAREEAATELVAGLDLDNLSTEELVA